jgi:hypothetical protein
MTRKPILLLWLSGLLLLRYAERQFCGLLIQEPPRSILVCLSHLLFYDMIALTPALSQVWEREQETSLDALAPLLPVLGEVAGG